MNDPYGVKHVKQVNAELLKKLLEKMKQLPNRKVNTSSRHLPTRPLERNVMKRIDHVLNIDIGSYKKNWEKKQSELQDIEMQIERLRRQRISGAIEKKHDMWLAERRWEVTCFLRKLM
jgi:hypothetical protein